MRRLTIGDIMRMHPCHEYRRGRVKELWAGRKSLTPLEILDLCIPIKDRFWVVLRPYVIGDRTCRVLAIDFAAHVLPLFERKYPTDTRPRRALEVAIRGLDGEATDEELATARATAWGAAWSVSRDASRAAAWAVSRDARNAAMDAVWAASWDARNAAMDAAGASWAAEQEWQLARVREVLTIYESEV